MTTFNARRAGGALPRDTDGSAEANVSALEHGPCPQQRGLQARQADPDELAFVVAELYGAALRGIYRVIEKALGVQHG